MKRHARSNHGPFRPHCSHSLLFLSFPLLVLRSRTTFIDTKAAAARANCSLFYLLLVLTLCNCSSSIHSPSQHLRSRHTIQNSDSHRSSAHVYKTALLLVKEGTTTIASIVFESRCLSPILLACFSPLSVIVRWNRCPHDLSRSLSRLPISNKPFPLVFSAFLSPLTPYLGRHPTIVAAL
jgi:hypothetical protein